MAILASQALQCENKKKFSNKMLRHWALNSLPQPFRSNALLSEPLRQVLLGRAEISWMVMLYWSGAGTKDNLRISQVSLVPSGSKRGALDPRWWVQCSVGTFYCWIFFVLFSHSKASDANIVIIVSSVCSCICLLETECKKNIKNVLKILNISTEKYFIFLPKHFSHFEELEP